MIKELTNEDITKHKGLVIKIISKWRKAGIPNDDLIAVANQGLMKAYKNYDSSKSAFSTYASRIIYNELADYVRHHDKLTKNHVYLDPQETSEDKNDLISVLGGTIEFSTDEIDAEKVFKFVQGKKKDILYRRFLLQETYPEIAQVYGLTVQRVEQIVGEALEDIRQASKK